MPGTIVSHRELARTLESELGGRPIARRRWALNLSDDTLTNGGPPTPAQMLTHCGVAFGSVHPDLAYLRARKITVNERFEDDPYRAEVVVEYGLITANDVATPTQRPAVWAFEARPSEIPALSYFHGNSPGAVGEGNNNRRPLTNSAFDYFPGLTTEESVVQIKIQKNFANLQTFNFQGGTINPESAMSWLSALNFVNNAVYLGCPAHTIKVAGVDVEYVGEEFNGSQVFFWATTATLVYRQSSHNLLLPDVGFNFLNGNEKRRAMVFDFKNNEWVASPNPVGLNGSGAQTFAEPAILNRRVYPEANLSSIFGTPPS